MLVAANSFYPEQLSVGEGGITRISSGEADLATNAETQLLRESLANPDLRIIMTVTESFYRLVARRSAGIETLADLKGKRVMLPRNTSAHYFLVAMLRTVGLTEEEVELVNLPPAQGDQTGMDQMSDALARGDVDVISIWEPEPEDAIHRLGDDAVVFQDRSVYREVFNLHARAPDLADPDKRRSIVTFVRAVAEATDALKNDAEAPLAARVEHYRVYDRRDLVGMAGDGVPRADRSGHAGRARGGGSLGRQGTQPRSAQPCRAGGPDRRFGARGGACLAVRRTRRGPA